MRVAVANGADAVYFGLAEPNNFNARSRAANIPLETLAETIDDLHRRNVKGYVALNTLVQDSELPQVAAILEKIAEANVDAVIVQDFGVAKLAKQVCSDLPIHSSTQMSLTSARSINAAQKLGIKRVVLPRELSLKEIRAIRRETDIELECFVHGALCISFSGQCYASLGLGGRSANRGCCAQPCRLGYKLKQELKHDAPPLSGETKQLLSPCDFAALPLLGELIATGINALKIEGRLKPPEYVAEVTRTYRLAIDDYGKTQADVQNVAEKMQRLSQTFSRGFSTGWLEGVQPRRLVPGNVLAHRGSLIGTVIEVRRDAAVVMLTDSVRRGDGVLFENAENPNQSQGGRVFEIFRRRESVKEAEGGAKVLLTFANHSINDADVAEGQKVWKTSDVKLQKDIRRNLKSSPQTSKKYPAASLLPIDIFVRAVAGEILAVNVRLSKAEGNQSAPTGVEFCIEGDAALEVARKHPLTQDVLAEQFSRLGETRYMLNQLDAEIVGNPMVPLSVLGKIRKEIVERLDTFCDTVCNTDGNESQPAVSSRTINRNALPELLGALPPQRLFQNIANITGRTLHLLFRDLDQCGETPLRGFMSAGCQSFYGEFRSMDEYKRFAETVRQVGAEFVTVLPRVIKSAGDSKLLNKIADLKPDAVLVRNLEELIFYRELNVPAIADFSFNVINSLSFQQVLDWGAERLTLGHDLNPDLNPNLDEARYEELLRQIPAERIEQIVIGRLPLFTMEHCLWRANLCKPQEPCNKICRSVPLQIEDRRGAVHSVRSDIFCRNIIERSEPIQSKPFVQHLRFEWDKRLADSPLDWLTH
ncbi:collagenase [Planctomycetales bacterium]|nr:collagenase [Planctomycetales bacterium]